MTKATFKSLFGVTLTLHPTYTDTQTHRHTDTQTHRHTDTQTHRPEDPCLLPTH
ncbi:MAG: hypothetical protein KA101_04590 [Saprospiraceae bacterium]|nr:hypothetical protein [Saprospiraceae bacterium]